MTQLYKLTGQMAELAAMCESDDESLIQAIQDTMSGIQGEFEDKADNIVMLRRNIEGDIGAIESEINRLEEVGDDLYVACMRNLHTTSTDPLEIIAWREIYEFFEKCCDTCENVADIIESIVIGNT